MGTIKRYKLKLNNIDKIEELLQGLYDETDKIIVEAQEQINRLANSTKLNDEIVDAKAKYAKAVNDFISSKDKAIGRKLEIAKIMTEIHKYNGNVGLAIESGAMPMDWDSVKDSIIASDDSQDDNGPIKYKIGQKR